MGVYDAQKSSGSLLITNEHNAGAFYDFLQCHTAPNTIVYTNLWADMHEKASQCGATGPQKRVCGDPNYAAPRDDAAAYWSYVYEKLSHVRPSEKGSLSSYLDEIMWRDRYGRDDDGQYNSDVALCSIFRCIAEQYPV